MKRNRPTEPIPDTYLEKNELDDEELDDNEDTQINVLDKRIFNYNLKKLKSFRNIRKKSKIRNLKKVFISRITVILKEYPIDSVNELNHDLLLEVCNISEGYFFYPNNKEEREKLKMDSVIQLMLPYFRSDLLLLNKTIELISNKIKKTNNLKRLYPRLRYFFLTMINLK